MGLAGASEQKVTFLKWPLHQYSFEVAYLGSSAGLESFRPFKKDLLRHKMEHAFRGCRKV